MGKKIRYSLTLIKNWWRIFYDSARVLNALCPLKGLAAWARQETFLGPALAQKRLLRPGIGPWCWPDLESATPVPSHRCPPDPHLWPGSPRRTRPSWPFSCRAGKPITAFLSSCAQTSHNEKVKHSWGTSDLFLPPKFKYNECHFPDCLELYSVSRILKRSFFLSSEVHRASTLGFIGVRLGILVQLNYIEFQHTKSNGTLVKWCNLALHIEINIAAGLPPMGKSDVILPDLVVSFTVFRHNQFCKTGLTLVWISLESADTDISNR